MSNDGKKESLDSYYICPVYKQPLTPRTNELFYQQDGVGYPVKNGIPAFIEDLTKSTNPFLRAVDKLDESARIYEGPSWLGIMDKISAELDLSIV